MYLISLRD